MERRKMKKKYISFVVIGFPKRKTNELCFNYVRLCSSLTKRIEEVVLIFYHHEALIILANICNGKSNN